jgi:outer membrane protein assembly factor BamA
MAGLHLAAPIDKDAIELACKKIQDTGIFASVSYRYAPGPKKGYAVTLTLADQAPLVAATIDVPGVDEGEVWRWLSTRFGRFDHQVPQVDAAQKFLAGEIERHIGALVSAQAPQDSNNLAAAGSFVRELLKRGQHLTVRMETDLRTRKLTLSFQPEVLPRVQSVAFTGNQAIPSNELSSVLNRIVSDAEYTDRKFAAILELNLRPVYEERGFYRVKLTPAPAQWSDSGVSVTVAIAEGAPYQLGKVEMAGDDLPAGAMLAAGKFPRGKLANWKQIRDGILEIERVVRRAGYFEVTASADRSYDDVAHVLDLRIQVQKGPLYRFGEVRFTGLSPDLEGRARRLWKPKPGDPYDYAFPNDFFQEFSRIVDFSHFRKYEAVASPNGKGDHVMDMTLAFEAR